MTYSKAYELEDSICETLSTKPSFLEFCTTLIGEECKIIGGQDFQEADPKEDYPCIIVNVDRQTGDASEGIDRSIEISILLNVSSERVLVGNYYKYADTPKAEKIAAEIYEIISSDYCGDIPPYYYEKDVAMIAQGTLRGSLEIVTSNQTHQGENLW